MSTPVIIGIVAAIAVIVIIAVAVSRRKKPEKEERLEEPAAEREPAVEEKAEKTETEEPAEEKPEEPAAAEKAETEEPAEEEEEAAPGVRLEEEAERTAAAELKAAKRERKLRKLRQGLAPTRGGLIAKIGSLIKGKKEIDPELLGDLEDTLLTADVGTKTTEWLVGMLREALDRDELADEEAVWGLLEQEVTKALSLETPEWDIDADKPHCVMVVGVNGVGKTTTIGKLCSKLAEQNREIVLAAADTFRAAAVNQLEIWGRRTGCEVVKSKEGADPSSVVFDAIKRAEESGADLVMADTAGRLHTKTPLMDELKKVKRVMGKAHEGAPHRVMLVLDATTGQNALQQVAEFNQALGVTDLVLTKLDGTAKGGVIIGVCHEHGIPVRYIGIGEAKDDLRSFEVEDFVEALFLREDEQEG
ncbi:MAG: signal recognition particle-docking protein FtsY [Polyangia bacterium]